LTGAAILQDFGDYLLHRPRPVTFRVTRVVGGSDEARFSISWYEDQFHTVTIRPVIARGNGHWLVRHSFNVGLSELIDDWLKQTVQFAAVRWYTREEWNGRQSGQDRPW
jgi:hypothetical protein